MTFAKKVRIFSKKMIEKLDSLEGLDALETLEGLEAIEKIDTPEGNRWAIGVRRLFHFL